MRPENANKLLRHSGAPLHHRALLRLKLEILGTLTIVVEVRQAIDGRFLSFGQNGQVVVEGAVNGRHRGYLAGEAIPARRPKNREHSKSNEILRIGHCSTTGIGAFRSGEMQEHPDWRWERERFLGSLATTPLGQ